MSEKNFEKLEVGCEYWSRDNERRVLIVAEGRGGRWVGQVVDGVSGSNNRIAGTWCSNGLLWETEGRCDYDLIRKIEPKRVCWVNINQTSDGDVRGFAHPSLKHATAFENPSCIARIRVEYTPGQFDE